MNSLQNFLKYVRHASIFWLATALINPTNFYRSSESSEKDADTEQASVVMAAVVMAAVATADQLVPSSLPLIFLELS